MQSCLYHQADAELRQSHETHTEQDSVSTGYDDHEYIKGFPSSDIIQNADHIPLEIGDENLFRLNTRLCSTADHLLRSSQLKANLKKYQKALVTARSKNNRVNQVTILKRIGLVHCKLGEYAWGIKCLKQALQLAQNLGNQVSMSVILNYLGAAYRQTGQDHKALRVYARALTICNQLGNRAGAALVLNHLSEAHLSLGQSQQALFCSRQALEKYHELGNAPDGEGTALHNIGEVYLQLKRLRQAIALFEQALTLYQKAGNRKGEAKILESLGTVHALLDQEPQALKLYQQALAIRQEICDLPNLRARSLDYIGAIYYKMGNPVRAVQYHLQALGLLQIYTDVMSTQRWFDNTDEIKKLLQNLMAVYDRLGLHTQGVKCYQDAVKIVQTFGENACEQAICNVLSEK
jgi:tetratricopeptide (TPR) repeat protein